MSGTTFVSMLFDLSKRDQFHHRSAAEYLSLGKWLLSQSGNLIVYTDPELFWSIHELNHSRATNLMVIPTELENRRWGKQVDAIRNIQIAKRGKEETSSWYIAVTRTKFELLEEVIAHNPFRSDQIYWVDFGLTHVCPPQALPLVKDNPRVRLLVLRPFSLKTVKHADFFDGYKPTIAGGYFGGPLSAMQEVCKLGNEVAISTMDRQEAPLEEPMLAIVAAERPDLVSFSYGGFTRLLQNFEDVQSWDNWDADFLTEFLQSAREQGSFDMLLDCARHYDRFEKTDKKTLEIWYEEFIALWYTGQTEKAKVKAEEIVKLFRQTPEGRPFDPGWLHHQFSCVGVPVWSDEDQYWHDMEHKQLFLEQVPDKHYVLYQNRQYLGHFRTVSEASLRAEGKRLVMQHQAECFGKPQPPRKVAMG